MAAGEYLGLTAARIRRITPRYFRAIWNVYWLSEKRMDARFAKMYELYANVNYKKADGTKFSAQEFLGEPAVEADPLEHGKHLAELAKAFTLVSAERNLPKRSRAEMIRLGIIKEDSTEPPAVA